MGSKNVFVIAPDEYNRAKLRAINEGNEYQFHELLDYGRVKKQKKYDLYDLLEAADAELQQFGGTIDGIAGFWDFPVSSLIPLLRHRHGMADPTFEAVAKCEHKYWSRVVQSEVVPKNTPKFAKVNPFDDSAGETIPLDFPFWLKPVKSLRSHLAFRIRNRHEYLSCLATVRENIDRLAAPFNFFLHHVNVPKNIRPVDGRWCIAEEAIVGRQCTVEGYALNGEVVTYGVVDSVRDPQVSTFSRYEYPSRLPKPVQDLAEEVARRVIRHIGLERNAFNIEFFWDAKHDRLSILEINPRISQSHADLFQKVDGLPNHKVMVDVALGQRPDFPQRAGKFACAAKFFFRAYEDGVMRRVPSEKEIGRVQEELPSTHVDIYVKEGQRLSDMYDQDAYSFELGVVFIGADRPADLQKRFQRCKELLPFDVATEQADRKGA